MILATQRPSVDVLTGLIKANFPARISFQVTSRVDSRTIIDSIGAERLLGDGDMLYLPPGTARSTRLHGAYVSDREIRKVVEFVNQQAKPHYRPEVLAAKREVEGMNGEDDYDEMYDQAVDMVAETQQASMSTGRSHDDWRQGHRGVHHASRSKGKSRRNSHDSSNPATLGGCLDRFDKSKFSGTHILSGNLTCRFPDHY